MSGQLFGWIADLRRRRVFQIAALYAAIAWAVVQVLDVVVPAVGLPGWVITVAVILTGTGFPIAVVLAWLFDVGPNGIVRTRPGSARGIVTISASLVFLVLATGGLVWLVNPGKSEGGPPGTTGVNVAANSVAVLPFENRSDDPADQYFSDGLTDTLLNMIAGVQQLKVAARTSSFAFKGQDRDIREIASAIGVSHVLEGSVQRSGERIRVSVQLVRASDGLSVWSASFDEVLEDVFDIQDQIAGEVATLLASSVLEPGQSLDLRGVTTTDIDAYELYLQAREYRIAPSLESLMQGEQLLKRALFKDPEFIDARLELATNYMMRAGFGPADDPELINRTLSLTEDVLEVEPRNPRARMIEAFVAMVSGVTAGDPDAWANGVGTLEAIRSEAPGNADLTTILAMTLTIGGQQQERALELFQEMLETDPLNPDIYIGIATCHRHLGNLDQAEAAINRAIELEPGSPGAHTIAATINQVKGDGVGYIRSMIIASELDPIAQETHALTAVFLYNFGMIEEGDHFRNKVLAMAPDSKEAGYLQLWRAVAVGDGPEVTRIARQRIRANSGENCCDFWDGIEQLIRQAAIDGDLEQTLTFIEQHRPGFNDLEYLEMPLVTQVARLRQINAIRGDRSLEEMNAYVARVDEYFKRAMRNRGVSGSPRVYIGVLVMRGEIDTAADVAVEGIFSDAMIHFQDWRQYFSQPSFADLIGHPRVHAELARWETEKRQMQQDIRDFLAAERIL